MMHFDPRATILAVREGFVPCGGARGSAVLALDWHLSGASLPVDGGRDGARKAKSPLARNKRTGCNV
ncbi:hypothetical protein [Paraburkholderia flagellata]|uniref:hypothetical protein n=1 Tax=Paraburkholderia flagellata TaxID=2883241 RepID=UPI001F424F49|nr:hypothetical protein [Paraburkholderia flagellata]